MKSTITVYRPDGSMDVYPDVKAFVLKEGGLWITPSAANPFNAGKVVITNLPFIITQS